MGENSGIQWTHHTPLTNRQRGALKSAAAKTGCASVEEWLSRREAGLLWCRTCRVWLPDYVFSEDRSRSSLRQTSCKDCYSLISAASRYGVSRKFIEELREAQAGLCAICGLGVRRLVLDHCHKTKRVRGLLCDGCNVALGAVERPGFIDAARRYLANG